MDVKGTGLTTTRDFIKINYPDKYNEWLKSLPDESKKFFNSSIDATEWYPVKEAYIIPVNNAIQLCFNGNIEKGADEIGRFSADMALKGFYKVFLLVTSPNYLIKRASKIFTTFYYPSEIQVVDAGSNSATLRIIKFEGINSAIEYRIAGWVKRALELTNYKNPVYAINKSLSKGDDYTDIVFSWS